MLHLGESTLRTAKQCRSIFICPGTHANDCWFSTQLDTCYVGRLEQARSGLLETAEGSPLRCAPLWLGARVTDTVPAAGGQVNCRYRR
jgi:hypothetical protein